MYIKVAPIILAGGLGRRVGIDKNFIKICGRNLIEYQINKLRKIFDKIFISCKENYEKLSYLLSRDVILLRDMFKIRHPLSGIVTASLILRGKYTHMFVLPVDLPNVSVSFIEYLISLLDSDVECIVPRWRNGYLEPLLAVYDIEGVIRFLKTNPSDTWDRVPVRSLASSLRRVIFISAEEILEKFGNVFLNVNTLQNLELSVKCI